MYMRKISAANSVASSPPVPARISSTTFFSSCGSLGSSRIFSSSSICVSSRLQLRDLLLRPSAAGRDRSRPAWRAPAPELSAAFFHSRYLATTSDSSLCALVTLRYWSASLMTAGSAICRVSSSKRFSICSSFWANCMADSGDDQLAALLSLRAPWRLRARGWPPRPGRRRAAWW